MIKGLRGGCGRSAIDRWERLRRGGDVEGSGRRDGDGGSRRVPPGGGASAADVPASAADVPAGAPDVPAGAARAAVLLRRPAPAPGGDDPAERRLWRSQGNPIAADDVQGHPRTFQLRLLRLLRPHRCQVSPSATDGKPNLNSIFSCLEFGIISSEPVSHLSASIIHLRIPDVMERMNGDLTCWDWRPSRI